MEKILNITAASKTDVGLVREENEDALLFCQPSDPRVFEERGILAVVADGVGGNSAGEVASRTAVETIQDTYFQGFDHEPIAAALERAVKEANRRIIDLSEKNALYKGMATTCTALVVRQSDLVIAHVGDSRAYCLRNGELRRLTEDHTLVNELLKKGLVSEEEAKDHPQSNVIVRALGSQGDIDVDVIEFVAEGEDCYLLCSDGLSNLVADEEIAQILSSSTPFVSCETMVELARQRGGYDNITVQVIKVSTNDSRRVRETRPITGEFPHRTMSWPKSLLFLLAVVGITVSAIGISIYFLGVSSDLLALFREFISRPLKRFFF